MTINLDASRFTKFDMDIVKKEPVSVALWYQQSVAYRKEKTLDLKVELKKYCSQPSGDLTSGGKLRRSHTANGLMAGRGESYLTSHRIEGDRWPDGLR